MLRHEASSSPCIAIILVEEDPSLSLRMTTFLIMSWVGRKQSHDEEGPKILPTKKAPTFADNG
jgi:hypothetical protein